MSGAQYYGVWKYHESDGGRRVTERVLEVCATKEQAVQRMTEQTLAELADEYLPPFERSRLFVQEIFVFGLVPA